jgi:hypothetical protein
LLTHDLFLEALEDPPTGARHVALPQAVENEQWTERIERFDFRGQTVAQFCAEEGTMANFKPLQNSQAISTCVTYFPKQRQSFYRSVSPIVYRKK